MWISKKYSPLLLTAVFALIIAVLLSLIPSRSKLELQSDTIDVLVFLVILLAVVYWLIARFIKYRQLKKQHANAELALLKSKINPHFFFNTLNNLYGLAIKKSDHTPDIILKLSEIMRYTIYDGENEHVPLYKEIDYLKKYIDIHRIRYKKRVEITFEENIDNSQQHIVPLLLIILLENAIKHGVEVLTDNAYVHVKLNLTGKKFMFFVENNYEEKMSKEGIGLSNLRKRLQLLYPNKHHLHIEFEKNVCKAALEIQLS